MITRLLLVFILLICKGALAAIGDGDSIDFAPFPNEFCNNKSDQKQRELLKRYPRDAGIIKIYALYIGLCQLVEQGSISEHAASILWIEQKEALIEDRKNK